jgi:hypothetical protein
VNPTSLSLLDRLKVARPEASDWRHLQAFYLPLIRRRLDRAWRPRLIAVVSQVIISL